VTLPDIDTLSTLGGQLVNADPVMDATTDLDADADNKSRADVAMMTRTGIRAMRRFTGHGTTPTDPASGFVHEAMWGSISGVKPTVVRSGAGIWLLTWTATQADELGESHSLNFRAAEAWVEVTSTTFYNATARVTAANVVEVRTFTAAGVLDDVVGFNVVVLVW